MSRSLLDVLDDVLRGKSVPMTRSGKHGWADEPLLKPEPRLPNVPRELTIPGLQSLIQFWSSTPEPATYWYVTENQQAVWVKFHKGKPRWWGFQGEPFDWRTETSARRRSLTVREFDGKGENGNG